MPASGGDGCGESHTANRSMVRYGMKKAPLDFRRRGQEREKAGEPGASRYVGTSGGDLLQVAGDFAEGGAEFAAQSRQRGDDRHGDQRGDKGVFDGGGARFIGDE